MRPSSLGEGVWWCLAAAILLAPSITAFQTALVLAALTALAAWGSARLPPPPPWPTALLGLLAGLGALAAARSADPARSLAAAGSASLWIVVPMGAAVLTGSRSRLTRAILLLEAGILGAWGVVEFCVFWSGDPLLRVRGPFSHHMTYAGVLLVSTALALPDLDLAPIVSGRAGRAWGRVLALLAAAGIAASLTRSAVLGAGAAVTVVLTTSTDAAPRRRAAWRGAAVLVAVAAVAIGGPWLLARAGRAAAWSASAQDRLVLWRAGWDLIADHPWLGVGPGGVRWRLDDYLPAGYARPWPAVHLHSAPLNLAAERGVPALMLLALLHASTLLRLHRLRRAAGPGKGLLRGCAASIVAFMVMGMFENNFDDDEVVFLHLLTLAMAWSAAGAPSGDRAVP